MVVDSECEAIMLVVLNKLALVVAHMLKGWQQK